MEEQKLQLIVIQKNCYLKKFFQTLPELCNIVGKDRELICLSLLFLEVKPKKIFCSENRFKKIKN